MAMRSRVIFPVSSPDCIGEYGMTPMLCSRQYGRISCSISGRSIEYGG